MASSGPPAKKLCAAQNFNVAKSVRFEATQDLVAVMKNYIQKKEVLPYKNALDQLQKGDIDNETAARWFKQLEDNIIILNDLQSGNKIKLVNVIVKAVWVWKCSDEAVKQYSSLIECLLSFNANYTSMVVESLVCLLVSKSKEDSVVDLGVPSDEESRLFNHVHKLLTEIVKLVPMASQVLFQNLKERFPFEMCDKHVQACYIINLLKATDCIPEFRKPIVEMIFARMKALDLECPWEEVQDAERNSICESLPEDSSHVELNVELKMQHKQANLLDVLMKAMFTFIQTSCRSEKGINGAKTKRLYKELLTAFDRQMILASGTCHVQFLMFYICKFHLKLCRGYLDYLWKHVLDTKQPNNIRQSAAGYMGSFVVRHATVSIETVRDCLYLMKEWIHTYVDEFRHGPGEKLDVHEPFYAVCQSFFNIVACRVEELIEMPTGLHFLSTLHLTSISSSCLNPLKYCAPSIVRLFVYKTKEHQIAYCYPFINFNDEMQVPVKAFFPFDPYLLLRSSEFIEPIYRVSIEQFFHEQPAYKDDTASEDELDDFFFEDSSTRDSLSYILD